MSSLSPAEAASSSAVSTTASPSTGAVVASSTSSASSSSSFLRLDPDATSFEAVESYYATRALQAAYHDWSWSKSIATISFDDAELPDAVFYETTFISPPPASSLHYSFYIPAQYRGKGLFAKLIAKRRDVYSKHPIVTLGECAIKDILTKHCIPVRMMDSSPADNAASPSSVPHSVHTPGGAYSLITRLYGSTRAKRTGVFYMNHIDEGLLIMRWRGKSSLAAQLAYALHPALQGDAELLQYSSWIHESDGASISSEVVLLAMEYRRVANAYLSPSTRTADDVFACSPLAAVNEMLVADKIQNYKDFLRFHLGSHPDSDRLQVYFHNWLRKLGVSMDEFHDTKKRLEAITTTRAETRTANVVTSN